MDISTTAVPSFFERPGVRVSQVPVGAAGLSVPLGIETVHNPQAGIAGAYGAWGESYDNNALPDLIAERLGEPLAEHERMHLDELGFLHRHHVPVLNPAEQVELEVTVGAQFVRQAALANGWEPGEVDAVLIGSSSPVCPDYTVRVCAQAGIRPEALKVSLHKACDGSVGGLHLALNPQLTLPGLGSLAPRLLGKKVLVGGIEGLSRFLQGSRDKNAWQLFGNAAGVIGLVPGRSLQFLVGNAYAVFDEEGLLQVRMDYPYAGAGVTGAPLLDLRQESKTHWRISGRQHEPADGSSVIMAGPMGMVKLFVRSGAQVVRDLYAAYQAYLGEHNSRHEIAVAIVHHANFKINKLLEKNLNKEGVQFPMPWLLSEFGNVSAASNMIAFLRALPQMHPGQHVLVDGFGAGTYYDALVFEIK